MSQSATRHNPSSTMPDGEVEGGERLDMAHLVSKVTSALDDQLNEVTVRKVLSTAFEIIMSTVEHGGRVSITNFGSWRPSERGPRRGMNIRTGQLMQIGERRVVTWSAGSGFKNRMRSSSSGSGSSRAIGGGPG